ncbi:DNA-binding transcriptional LysR family regulator [Labedella gwakjiensis]|uniref:DNA-binding transcriptional LysR family regulator n=1 Tax=Labedella gwakjiensis TaxID=390269 RepID=A0A2P8GYS6_9MICO|nr:LysR family transcriptional regulator [Labedella gwakjiensis]PSL39124.1 DNA-binding transcriptional LysR family regulator [Labedella gwakjiensis]RUQ86434.1 LysR family transcriptional regulator [Labedella gwakjiensis]
MTITQLRAFLLAATLGTFTAAATALGTTQPTVSELVRKLELEAGLDLFVRTGRRLVLTAAGRELLAWAQRVVDGVDGAAQSLGALKGLTGGVASFGVLRNASYYFLSDLAERFHHEHPGVRLRLVGQNSFEVAEGVRSGELEAGLAMLPIPDEGLAVTPLLRDEVLWVSADPARTSEPMQIEAIPAAPLILYDAHYGSHDPTRRQLADRAQLQGVRLDPLIEVENVDAALALVARGIGDTLVSRSIVSSDAFPDGLHVAPFAEPLFDTMALLVRENAALSPVTAELVRMATAMVLVPREGVELI